MKHPITIGCDPELFAYQADIPISVHDLLPGTKHKPAIVPLGAIQVDGVAAEFNINPAKTRTEFIRNINSVTSLMQQILNRKNSKLTLLATPCAYFNTEYFNSLPDEVKELGCNSDFNAYTLLENPKPFTEKSIRTGAGHIHIGFQKIDDPFYNVTNSEHMKTCSSLVKELDFVLFNSSLHWDTDEERRQLYGNAGAFRPKSYGVEYRVLSNAWLNSESTKSFIFDATMATTQLWYRGISILKKYSLLKTKPNTFSGYCNFLENQNIRSILYYTKENIV